MQSDSHDYYQDSTDERGRYQVNGSTLLLSPSNGGGQSYDVKRAGGALLIGGTRYIPCD